MLPRPAVPLTFEVKSGLPGLPVFVFASTNILPVDITASAVVKLLLSTLLGNALRCTSGTDVISSLLRFLVSLFYC